jgi:hypothetical protein
VARIVKKHPIFSEPRTLPLPGGGTVAIKGDQLILWASITPSGLPDFPASAPRFPVILDTGFNHTFLLGERHLEEWGGLKSRDLTWIDLLTADGQPIPLRDADLWLHPNQPHTDIPILGAAPFRLELPEGIAVWPSALPGSRRLPLLGTRALRRGRLHADLNFRDGWFSIYTRRWLWFLG